MKKAIKSNYGKINSILTRAFRENKSVNYVIKKKRDKYISRLMAYSLYIGEHFGDIFINESETACAIIIDPKKKITSMHSVWQDVKFAINISGLSKVNKVYKKELITKNTLPKDIDSVQLWFLGVSIDHQGKGEGSKLLNNIIDYYKGKKQAICLETSTLRNLPFYKKNGFEIYDTKNFGFDFYFLIYKYS